MNKYEAAKAAAKARAGGDEDLFRDAPGVYVVLRNLEGRDTSPVLRGTWNDAREITYSWLAHDTGPDRRFRRALQLYDRTWLYIEEA